MTEENEIKERIITTAGEMFMRFGYSKVTMEEIASSLGMSKKTLYKFFSSKENLVRDLIKNRQCEFEEEINKIWAEQGVDFVIKLKKMMNFIGKQSTKLRGPLLEDLHKSIPEIWQEIHDFKKMNGLQKARQLFLNGVDNGVFRDDIGRDLILLIYTSAVEAIINPETLSQLPFSANQAVETIFKVIFEGILTEEGRMKYVSYQTEETNSKENSSNETN